MTETPLDRIARALGPVVVSQRDGVDVVMSLSKRLEIAHIALSVLRPEMDRLRSRGAEPNGVQSGRVLPARFVTDAMAGIPDTLPPDFA